MDSHESITQGSRFFGLILSSWRGLRDIIVTYLMHITRVMLFYRGFHMFTKTAQASAIQETGDRI